MESHVAKASGLLFDLSVEQVAMCTQNPQSCGGTGGCAGATSELAFDYVASSTGLFQEYQYSYNSYYGSNYACAIPTGKTFCFAISYFIHDLSPISLPVSSSSHSL
jgi:cathepsin L